MKEDLTAYRILVVEDNSGDLLLIREYLAELIPIVAITEARSFRDVVHLLEREGGQWDVVLLDLTLPDRSGVDLILDVLRLCSGTPVIVLTGYTDQEFGVRSLSLGVSDYLIKDELYPEMLYKSIVYTIERGKVNTQLVESEKRYSDMFQLSPIPMWLYDMQSVSCLAVNEAAIDSYGYSRAEFLNMTARDLRTAQDMPELDLGIETLRTSIDQQMSGTFRHQRKDGSVIIADLRARIITVNRVQVVLVIAHDETDRINRMSTIEAQNIALKEITWIQSHVVRAPLARIMGLVDVIEGEPVNSALYCECLKAVSESAKELDVIVRGIILRTHAVQGMQ